METEKKQRDWMDWVQTGAAVSAAWDIHQIRGWVDRKIAEEDEAKQKARLESAVAEARTLLEDGIRDLPDNVYGYCKLKYLRDVTDRPELRARLSDLFDMCDARLRWMLKGFASNQARRVQDYARFSRVQYLLSYLAFTVFETQRNFKSLTRKLIGFLGLVLSIALAYYLFTIVKNVEMAFVSGTLGSMAYAVSLMVEPRRDQMHQTLCETRPWTCLPDSELFSSEQYQAMVQSGAISQGEADRKFVNNIWASFGLFVEFFGQFSDLQTRFKAEEAAFERSVVDRAESERLAAKREAEMRMEERYATENEKEMEERYGPKARSNLA
jgi:hypothetical protein